METNAAGVRIQRFPYEEPYHLNLVISATNGGFCGRLEFYCNAQDLADIGKALKDFPTKVPDGYAYELGAAKQFAYHFAFRANTLDPAGHCALQITMDNRRSGPDAGACCFSIEAEPAAINRLGRLLLEFAQLKHLSLTWTPAGDGDSLV